MVKSKTLMPAGKEVKNKAPTHVGKGTKSKTLQPAGEELKNPNLTDSQREQLVDDEDQQRTINEQLRIQDEMEEGAGKKKTLEQAESVDELDFVDAAYTGHKYDGRQVPQLYEEDAQEKSIASAFLHGAQRGVMQSVTGVAKDGRLADLQERLNSAAAKEKAANAEFANREPTFRHHR